MPINLEICKAQLMVEAAYVQYFQARIVSGVYKTREVYHGGYGDPNRVRLSEQELLEDELNTMHAHIRRMNEIIEVMPTD